MGNKFQMERGITYSRGILAYLMGLDDRSMRAKVRDMRRAGIPVMAMKDGGYKIAETDDEKKALLDMYRTRALDELTTYSKLMKSMQVAGQIAVDEFIRNMGG